MWNLLLTAAIAGSTGFIAKHVFTNYHSPPEKCEQEKNLQEHPAFESPPGTKECHGYESNCDQEGIFRFSSSAAGSRRRNKKKSSLKEKPGVLCRRLKFATENVNRSGGLKGISGRKLCACSKKKRTESSLFGRGLDVGIMYMMSAGKAEISKLSTAMDETSKIIHELRAELYNRKSTQLATSSKHISTEQMQLVVNRIGMVDRDPNDMELCGLTVAADDVECPSSVLTEEPEPAVLEMDQLEAELESELQKLPWSSTETSGHDVTRLKFGKAEVSSEGFCELEGANDVSYQCSGVMPSELDNKLCHLLIEQQENQITGLESELNLAQSQLHEKEAELEALKDCVRRLTEFSLSNISDDEDEVQPELECNTEWDKNSQTGSESRKSVVGMKRPIDSA
ncbi:hypothetical protein OIU77_030692 [Salix suchowensis]|uniref:Uncharacterized protein n=2 Tax=Salix TaxID=40685 RepID=A0ABQ9BCV1_9ROSI|nr:protein CASP [Salix suchowensis]KAJ6382087.1 hypothetical protein OIU77_030692 [Salix suchowensis]